MDTKKSIVVLTVIEEKNITEASKILGYTPSGVSRIIDSLEKELGFPLFIRSHDGVLPTTECCSLLPLFQQLTALDKTLTESAEDIRGLGSGRIRIGNAYTAYTPKLFDVITEFQKEFPDISIELKEDVSSQLIDDLLMNELDLCICSRRPGSFDWVPLMEDPMVVMVDANHPLASSGTYPLRLFEREPYIDFSSAADTDARRTLKKYGIQPNTRFETSDNYSTYLLVKAGMGVTLTNAMYTRTWSEGIIALRPDPPVEVSIGIAVMNRQYLSPPVKKFLSRFASAMDTVGVSSM